MKECAFCLQSAKLSGEHIFSDWMNDALPPARGDGKWTGIFTRSGDASNHWKSAHLNWKTKVVCEKCNNGWMHEIEDNHAIPVMSPLIAGKVGIPINQSAARSIAIFAFKTAVIIDLLRHDGKEPFFSRRLRADFRKHLAIPSMVNMWLCAYAPRKVRRADVFAAYYSAEIPLMDKVQLYVCTYGIGKLAFQILAVKTFSSRFIFKVSGFEELSVPFWPEIEPGFVWPQPFGLRSVEEFTQYHRRWENLTPLI
jgi:hypothetical protein